ncbi:MAG: hypothetical protein Q9159_001838 [Coniocarpon cinnabarinum]
MSSQDAVDVKHAISWNSFEIDTEYRTGRIVARFDDFLQSSEAFSAILFALDRFGLAFIKDVPLQENAVEQIGERIGPLRHTFYGRTWDVKDKPNAENVAYTATELGLHMDLLYMKEPPGLQLLHCINSSSNGGKSVFCDAFAAASDLYNSGNLGQRHFDILSRYPVGYHYNQVNQAFFDQKTVFEVEPERSAFVMVSNHLIHSRVEHESRLTADSGEEPETCTAA